MIRPAPPFHELNLLKVQSNPSRLTGIGLFFAVKARDSSMKSLGGAILYQIKWVYLQLYINILQ